MSGSTDRRAAVTFKLSGEPRIQALARCPDLISYPDDDLTGIGNDQGQWVFVHKDGTSY